MSTIINSQLSTRAATRKTLLGTGIGNAVEWYDWAIYATFTPFIASQLFSKSDPASAVLSTLAIFAVGFVARPFGGFLFGWIGDRIGRKASMTLAVGLASVGSLMIGIAPTFAAVGVWASLTLLVARLIQGLAHGGELPSSQTYLSEMAPKEHRGFWATLIYTSGTVGILFGTLLGAVLNMTLSTEVMNAWGWRIPFLISIVLVIVGLFIRMAVMESPAFKAVKESGTESEKPLAELIRDHKRDVLTAMGMRIAENGTFYIFTVFVLAYGEDTLKLSKNTMLTGVIIAAAVGLFSVPFWGALSDRVGRRKLYMAGAVFTLLFAFPYFALLDTKEPVLIWLAIVLAVNVGHDLMYGPQAAYFSELFATRMRYTGASIGYQLASVFGGGFAPLIAVALLAAGGGDPYLVALYMVGMGVITVVATHYARETFRSDLADDDVERKPTERFVRKPAADREPAGVA